jgi:pilus assembly protein Flp/PilA
MRALIHSESGQDLIEYALLGALVALGCVASMNQLATGISKALMDIGSDIKGAVQHRT